MADTREKLIAIDKQLVRLTKLVERIGANQKQDAKWRRVFRRQIYALVRHACLVGTNVPNPSALSVQRFRL